MPHLQRLLEVQMTDTTASKIGHNQQPEPIQTEPAPAGIGYGLPSEPVQTDAAVAEIGQQSPKQTQIGTEYAEIGHNKPPEPVQIERVRVRVLPDGRMTRNDAAKYLGVAVKTVRRWRDEGQLPPAIQLGGVIRWRPEAIESWLREQEGNQR